MQERCLHVVCLIFFFFKSTFFGNCFILLEEGKPFSQLMDDFYTKILEKLWATRKMT